MVRAKTDAFWLTETVILPAATAAGGRVQGEISLGSYVDVGDQQALAVLEVDFIVQTGSDFGSNAADMVNGDGSISCQVTDLNPGTLFVRADNNSLVASMGMNIDQSNNVVSHSTDFYPDNYGKLDSSFFVVNDSLFVVAGVDSADISAIDVIITARIRAKIVKLDQKAWMAIAIASTASDN